MRLFLFWINTILCIFGIFAILGLIKSPGIGKDQLIGALIIWLYMICVSIALGKSLDENY